MSALPEQTAYAGQRPLIELKNVSKSFGGKRGAPVVPVLRDISLQICAGEFVAIIGASGSGKSTLMNILGCLDVPDDGQYLLAGEPVNSLSADQLAWVRREAFGFVFQSYHLIPGLDVLHNVQLPAMYAGAPAGNREERARQLLDQLGLPQRTAHMPRQLSGGQQQRVSIARALMNGGSVILADEPTGALDSASGRDVMALFRDVWQAGHTLILITHDPNVAAQANRVIQLCDGRIIDDSGQAIVHTEMTADNARKLDLRQAGKGASAISDIREALAGAWQILWRAWFRTLLTLLGIVIGVASVIVLMGVGIGASEKTLASLNATGNTHRVSIWAQNDPVSGILGQFSHQDVEIVRNVDNVEKAVPFSATQKAVKAGNRTFNTWVLPASADGVDVLNIRIKAGIFFSREDEQQMKAVAVLGFKAAAQLFPTAPGEAIGRHIQIEQVSFRVVGIRDETGDDEEDHTVMVPVESAAYRLIGHPYFFAIQTRIADVDKVNETVRQIEQVLTESRRRRDFRVFNNPVQAKAQSDGSRNQAMLLTLVSGISLVVGGIGIMNIMLMAVKERTREIGIRMAIGARARDIRRQFLSEAVLLSLIGGLLGVSVALAICSVLMLLDVPVIISIRALLLAFSSAMVTGLIFGYMPARQAAKMNPVLALTGE